MLSFFEAAPVIVYNLPRFEKYMSNGIAVGGREYVFLAYSASQLRKSAYWAVAEVPTN